MSTVTTGFALNTQVKYRREGFGGVALHVPSRAAHFYNGAGARVLEACAERTGLDSLVEVSGSDASAVSTFLAACQDAQIVTSGHGGPPQPTARRFFTDVEEFPPGAFFAPLAVEIETTMKCYRACTYCAYESGIAAASPDELSLTEWVAVMDQLEADGVFYLHFTGGDPLTRADFPDLLAAADERQFVITVSSDLTVLDERQVDLLAETRNLYALQTTLDGATPESADLQRGRGNFARVTRGLRMLQERAVPVTVGTIVTKANVDEIAAIGRYLEDFGIAGYCIAPLYPAGRGRELTALVPDNRDLAHAVAQFRLVMAEGKIPPADPAWWSVVSELSEDEIDHLVDDQPYLARQPDRILRIDPTGSCYTSVKLKEQLSGQAFVGNIRHSPVQAMWQQAPFLRRLRELEPTASRFGNVIDVRQLSVADVVGITT